MDFLHATNAKEFADAIASAARLLTAELQEIEDLRRQGDLHDLPAESGLLLTETVQELVMLSKVLHEKSDALLASERQGRRIGGRDLMSRLNQNVGLSLGRLEGSLNDQVGSQAIGGTTAIQIIADDFATIDANHDGKIGVDDLKAASKGRTSLALAAKYLLDNPMLFQLCTRFNPSSQIVVGTKAYTGLATRGTLLAVIEENNAMTQLLIGKKFLPDEDNDAKYSIDELKKLLKHPIDGSTPAFLEALRYLVEHKDLQRKLDVSGQWAISQQGDFKQPQLKYNSRFTFADLIAAAVNQQALVNDPVLARQTVVSVFPTVAQGGKSVDLRAVDDAGLRSLAVAGLSASSTLRDQVEFVAFLPESNKGTRNNLITAFYSRIAVATTKWMNATLTDPLNVKDPKHTGWPWMMIAPNASNSVHASITNEQKIDIPIAWWDLDLDPSARNYLADGNQIIFTDVAVRIAALLEAFPPGRAVTKDMLKDYFDDKSRQSQYKNDTKFFVDGDRDLRDAMYFMLAARDSTNAPQRQQLNFEASARIAIHEQAAIQHQLEGLFLERYGDVGVRSILSHSYAVVARSSTGEIGTELQGRLQLGDPKNTKWGEEPGPLINVSKDTDRQKPGPDGKQPLYTAGPLAKRTLTSLVPDEIITVSIGGQIETLDGSSIGVRDITGWAEKGFTTNTSGWVKKGSIVKPVYVHVGEEVIDVSVQPTSPSDATGATDWSNYEERMLFIGMLFKQETFDPRIEGWVKQLSVGRLNTRLNFVPENIKTDFIAMDKTK